MLRAGQGLSGVSFREFHSWPVQTMREKKSNTFEGLAIRMKIQGETVGERCFEKIAGSVRDAAGAGADDVAENSEAVYSNLRFK
jgi:hypothetical protein